MFKQNKHASKNTGGLNINLQWKRKCMRNVEWVETFSLCKHYS